MKGNKNVNVGFVLCITALLLIIVTRAVGLTYNLSLHPDESEFYNGSKSLAQSLLDPSVPFVEEKEYPEGAYVLQLPFQLMKEFLGSSHWLWRASHCWSRISSVFYFTLAVVYGILILTKYMSRSKTAAILYALTMCFSLFFIEHSRYGVGDMGSLWLVMVTVYHSARGLETKKMAHLAFAFYCTGVLGAVKYPQIFFILIPLGTYLHMCGKNRRKQVAGAVGFVLVALLGLMMFSPKAAVDPAYFLRVISREGDAYVTEGTGYNSGGVVSHLVSVVLYTLLYSDFPLSFLFVAVYFCRSVANRQEGNAPEYLFKKLLPVVFVAFFAYNLFVKLLMFRTYTPFFGITALYSAEVAGKLYIHRDKRGRRTGKMLILLLTCLMVLRGGWLLQITGQQGDEKARLTELFSETVDSSWNRVTLFSSYNVAETYTFEDYMDCPQELSVTETNLYAYAAENNGLTLRPGELVITGAFRYPLGASDFAAYQNHEGTVEDMWTAFQRENQDYYAGQIYPDSCYYLFGGWIRGNTLAEFLIPCNMVYYRGE